MVMKKAEFLDLTMGTRTVKEYLHAFNTLSRYAPEFVNNDENKIASFKRGLSSKLMKTMSTSSRTTFNEFLNDCIMQENSNNVHAAAKSRKRANEGGSSQARAPPAYRTPYRPPMSGAKYRPPQKKNTNYPAQNQQKYQKAFKVPALREKPGRAVLQGLECSCLGLASIAIRRVTWQGTVLFLGSIRVRILLVCTTPPLRKFLQESL